MMLLSRERTEAGAERGGNANDEIRINLHRTACGPVWSGKRSGQRDVESGGFNAALVGK